MIKRMGEYLLPGSGILHNEETFRKLHFKSGLKGMPVRVQLNLEVPTEVPGLLSNLHPTGEIEIVSLGMPFRSDPQEIVRRGFELTTPKRTLSIAWGMDTKVVVRGGLKDKTY